MLVQRNPRARGTQLRALESSPACNRDSMRRRTAREGPLQGIQGTRGCARFHRALVGSVRRRRHGRRSRQQTRALH